MTQTRSSQVGFRLGAGALCLDFTQTLRWRLKQQRKEFLTSYDELVRFGQETALLNPDLANQLRNAAVRRPADAAVVLNEAMTLREAIYRVFTAISIKQQPAQKDLESIKQALAVALSHRTFIASNNGFSWGWIEQPLMLDRVVWPIALSAAELLTSDQREMIHQCAAEDCALLFLDTSRNRRRRWCDMQTCGNRAKVSRFRARRQSDGD
ncbi:MAG: CGNR zinc finger domain-containing protein [Chloroflexales bacterium]|nr:CGNR zinc finger domain-containing protein [Chloroflexales bacterium]